MTQLDQSIADLLSLGFDRLPPERRARAYGVDYAHLVLPSGSEIYLTRQGWSLSDMVVPHAWYAEQRFVHSGQRLPGSTGTVYRVPALAPKGATSDLVVKFSRVAQDVPIFVDKPVAGLVPRAMVESAAFNDPFEEFGLLEELRRGPFSGSRPRILTKRALAIYSPATEYAVWELGRKADLFAQHAARLEADQARTGAGVAVSLNLRRDYIEAFQWVKGLDAEAMFRSGGIGEGEMTELYHRSNGELAAHGFVMLDNKPRHLILRPGPDGAPLRHHDGRLAYALIDFELLKRV